MLQIIKRTKEKYLIQWFIESHSQLTRSLVSEIELALHMYCAKHLFPLLPEADVPGGINSEAWWMLFERISQDATWLRTTAEKDDMLPFHLAAVVSAYPHAH
jgi:hypothetical protein